MVDLTKLVEEATVKAAHEAHEHWKEQSKIQDLGAVKLEIVVVCQVNHESFAPLLQIVVNGEKRTGEINRTEEDRTNRKTIWVKNPIRKRGREPIAIELRPTASGMSRSLLT